MKCNLSFFGLGLCLAISLFSLANIEVGRKDKERLEDLIPPDARQMLRHIESVSKQIQTLSNQHAMLQEHLRKRPNRQPYSVSSTQTDIVVPQKTSGFEPIKGEGPNDQCVIEFPFLEPDDVYHLIKLWWSANCPANIPQFPRCTFRSIGRLLLHHAIQQGRTLVTLQIGAMDGQSNDPMYDMYAAKRKKEWDLRKQDHFPHLKNWLPILLEPVPSNYQNLLKTYKALDDRVGLPCAIPMNAAISYDATHTECAFCRYDTSETAHPDCSQAKDWMKTQIGTLDCEYSKRFFGDDKFEKCVTKDPLPCGPVKKLVQERAPYLPDDLFIAMVQIDVEAYEYILLEGLVKDLNPLPPIIHFENKVMRNLDRKEPLKSGDKRLELAFEALRNVEYQIYEEGEDTLAFLLPDGLQNQYSLINTP